MAETTPPLNLRGIWDFADPAASEQRFRELLAATTNADDRLQVQTQIARAQTLQRNFAGAHATLDTVEASIPGASATTRVRYFLERGRAFNSSNDRPSARPLFLQAWEDARAAALDDLAVDAAHMLGIIEPPDIALEWNEKAVAAAEASTDPAARQWLGALYNNIGWTYYDKQDYPVALDYFQRDEKWYLDNNAAEQARIARYSIGKTLRAMNQPAQALMIQQQLASDMEQNALPPDGYVIEEIAECHLALGRAQEAAPWFARAHVLLSPDPWLAANEPQRLERLKQLSAAT